MTVEVYDIGKANYNAYNVPSNPLLKLSGYATTTDRIYTLIYPDNSTTENIVDLCNTANTPESNLENTEGYRIKTYDDVSGTGLLLDTGTISDADFNTNFDYFVLLHADNYNLHHIAKITAILTEDVRGDAIEFEPKLGNEIAEGTKYMIFKGPAKSSNIIALSLGILNNPANQDLITAKPYFYFYNSKLDKKNELNHNAKYFIRQKNGNSATVDFSTGVSTRAFITKENYIAEIKDYSKYSMKFQLLDNLKVLDDPSTHTSNEGLSLGSFDSTDYNTCFTNSRRDSDGDITSLSFTGPYRYVYYTYSPTKNNFTYDVIDMEMNSSIGQKGSIVKGKIGDSFRIQTKKIKEFDKLRIRHSIYRGKVTDWINIDAEVSGDSSTGSLVILTFRTTFDLNYYFSIGDEVKIGDYILIVNGFSTAFSNNTQTVSFIYKYRLEEDMAFTNAKAPISIGDKLYRREFNSNDNTLMTNFNIIENRNSNLYVKFLGKNFEILYLTVTNADADKKLLTVSFDGEGIGSNPLIYYSGEYIIEVERLNGEIEQLTHYKENGQTFLEFVGRDGLNKLLSANVTKNTLFSDDIIYSSNSPYVKLEDTGYIINSLSFRNKTLLLSSSAILPSGTLVYLEAEGKISYIGEISSGSGTTFTLKDFPLVSRLSGVTNSLYKAVNTPYVFNKALSSNPHISSVTSLIGSSNKGIYFTGGTKTDSSITNGEGNLLVGSASSNTIGALGYDLKNHKSISKDKSFQAEINNLTDEVVNSLIDFTIYNIKERKNSLQKTITIAPYIPITLGRVENNQANTFDVTFTSVGTTSTADTDTRIVQTTDTSLLPPSTLNPFKYIKKPLYLNEVFLGYITNVTWDNTTVSITLDRLVSYSSGDSLSILTYDANYEESSKLTHELHLLNASHLHGGKFIGRLHPKMTSGEFCSLLNYSNTYTDSAETMDYIQKYGNNIYRIMNIEKGNVNSLKITFSNTDTQVADFFDYYYEKLSNINYYASAYKIESGYYYSGGSIVKNIIGTDLTNNITNHLLPESRGIMSSRGSNFHDIRILANDENYGLSNTPAINYSVLFNQNDPKVSRMFLFINCDREAYSSKRIDSLLYKNSGATKKISNYGLLGLKNPKITNRGDTKDNKYNLTQTLNFVDNDYTPANILSSSSELADLKRFSIMRLTECVFDCMFNQIDPENIVSSKRILPKYSLKNEFLRDKISFSSISVVGNTMTFTSPISRDLGSYFTSYVIYDKIGNKIGKVSSDTSTTITFVSAPIKTINGGYAPSPFYVFDEDYSSANANGKGENDSAINEEEIHLLKGVITRSIDDFSNTGTTYNSEYGSISTYSARRIHLLSPINIDRDYFKFGSEVSYNFSVTSGSDEITLHSSAQVHTAIFSVGMYLKDDASLFGLGSPPTNPPYITEIIDKDTLRISTNATGSNSNATLVFVGKVTNTISSKVIENILTTNTYSYDRASLTQSEYTLSNSFGVILDRFGVEDGSSLLEKGMISTPIFNTNRINNYSNSKLGTWGYGVDTAPFVQETLNSSSTSYDKHTDGAYLAFKLTLSTSNAYSINTAIPSNTGNIYQHIFYSFKENSFLDFVDLTGCYLVSQEGIKYDSDGSSSATTTSSKNENCQGNTPNVVSYIISHEIDTTEDLDTDISGYSAGNASRKHILITDKTLTTNMLFRIMQPNHTCFYDYSPKKIRINELSHIYTKKPNVNEMYSGINDFYLRNNKSKATLEGNNEAILSMYVLLENEQLISHDNIILNNNEFSSYFGENSLQVGVSDGDISYLTTMQPLTLEDTIGRYLIFEEIKQLKGVVSISETVDLEIVGDITNEYKRCLIGSTVKIANESENIINDLFEENNLEYTLTTKGYDYYLAPSFRSISLFEAINYVLERIDYRLYFNGESYTIASGKANSNYTKIIIGGKNNIVSDLDSQLYNVEIYEFEKLSTLFDYYNEIIVYGLSHTSTRKNYKEIEKRGRKTLEYSDVSLITQSEVDKKATDLLILHNSNNIKYKVKVGHSKISQIQVGDIISMEIPSENIPLDRFLVLQITYLMTGLIELELGRYTKDLGDRFAELLISSKKNETTIREENLDNTAETYNFLEAMKPQILRYVVRTRTSTGYATLGFSTTLKTHTSPLGFGSSGSVSLENLVDEEI